MRNYLYLWHQPRLNQVVASGIQFRDLVPDLVGAGGLVLLRHHFAEPQFDPRSGFEFVEAGGIDQLAGDNVYDYGDFSWADFGRDVALADLTDAAIAALTFFAHAGRPYGAVEIPGLGNRFLYWGHDDGWYARIFYSRWDAIAPMLRRLLSGVLDASHADNVLDLLHGGAAAYWCANGVVVECEQTEDIDSLQQTYSTQGKRP
jgi:hypothetical protein